jgi:glycosyltransferase involved in cell wall biosynthesis
MSWGFDLMQDVHKGRLWEFATRYTLKHSAFFISDAYVTREKAIAYGMDPNKTIVFPWGVDLEQFHVETLKRSNLEMFTLFCNRSWEPLYGVDILTRAFVKVAQQRKDVELVLLNGGSQGNIIRGLLQKGDVLDRVTFGGQIAQANLPHWYHAADLYISASHVDGSSVSLMEALASGLPCLVSDIPANKEWIEEGVNGWLFRDGNVDDLAEKILIAIKNRKSLKNIGEAARKTAEQKADWKKNFGKLLEVYEKIHSR